MRRADMRTSSLPAQAFPEVRMGADLTAGISGAFPEQAQGAKVLSGGVPRVRHGAPKNSMYT
jgi:hypothetical protein